jgi:hypothetical protein
VNLQKWALVADITSGIAVVVTLVVLILEVRGNTEALLAGNRQAIAVRTSELAMTIAGDPELAAIQARFVGRGVDAETQQATSYIVAVLQTVQEAYFLRQEGSLDEATWRTRANFALVQLQSEYGRARWERIKVGGTLVPEFTQWIDAELAARPTEESQ